MSDIIYKKFSEQKDGWYAIAACPFCGEHTSKEPAKYDGDGFAMDEAVSVVKLHMKSCSENPDREKSEMDEYLDEILGRKKD